MRADTGPRRKRKVVRIKPPGDVKSEADLRRGERAKRRVREVRDVKSERDLDRAERYASEQRDVKSDEDRGRGRQESAANIRAARIEHLRETREPAIDLDRLLYVISQGGRKSGKGRRIGVVTSPVDQQTISGGVPLKAARNIGLATADDPAAVGMGTLRGGRDALLGIPGAAVKFAADTASGTRRGDPLKGVKNVAKDYGKELERRYGPLFDGPEGERKFRERIKEEGAAGEVFDASTFATGATGVVGRGLGSAAKAGKLGAKAERLATAARPALRVSGGKAVAQELSPNLIVAAGQKAADKTRVKRRAKRIEKAERTGQRVDAIDAAATAGEVAPMFERTGRRAQRKDVARRKAIALQQLKREQATEVHRGAMRDIASLSPLERDAFKYAQQLGAVTPDAAVRALRRHREQIDVERQRTGVEVPRVLERTNDELPVIDRLLKNPEQAFTPRLRDVVRAQQARERRVAHGDPGLDPVQAQLRRYAQQAEHLGVRRAEGETDAVFLRRVKRAAGEEGLARPGYFPSQKRPTVRYSDYALGGSKAVQDPKRYTGALFRTGREDVRPEIFAAGLARGIKRKWNWNMVAASFDRHAFDWAQDMPVSAILDELDRRGIDPSTVALWNPGRYRAAQRRHDTDDIERTGSPEEPVAVGLDKAVDEAAIPVSDIATMPEDFRQARGYSLIPRAVYDEIHADTRPSGKVGRSLDVAKGKQARVMLGLSPAWLQFQVASNALLTGLAGTGIVDFGKAQLWWKRLSDAEKAAIEPYVGVGHFQDAIQQTKLGAAANGELVNAWRAFKDTPFFSRPRKTLGGATVKDLNPLDALFRVDQAQNNAFRRAVLYSQVKRDAYRRMGDEAGAAIRLQAQLQNTLKLGPEAQMKAVLDDMPAIERHAQHVNDFLGDYITYTARERRVFQRSIMFYGFLRYSLRFAFWTMPTKHPLMSSIIGQLGRMQTEEVRQILGGDELPWRLGRFYFEDDGQLKSVDLSRANPALNTVTQLRAPKDVLGLMPPLGVAILDQIYSKSSFRDRPFRVEGETQGRKSGDYGLEERARIFTEQMLKLAAPYRTAEEATFDGRPQGDDTSLLFGERPTEYKDKGILAGIAADRQRLPESFLGRAAQDLLPLIPREDYGPEIARSIRHRDQPKPKRKVKRKRQPAAQGSGYFPDRSSGSSGASSASKSGGYFN